MRRGRRGLTLIELLVAMSILLVGIYAVAAGFPSLFGTLESERIRTEMARRVEARMERLKTTPMHVPAAITGLNPDTAAADVQVPPDTYPDEMATPIPANPRDDLTWVLAEAFEVPIAREDPTVAGLYYSVYPLAMGLASAELPQVNLVRQLERVDAGLPMDTEDDFRIEPDGTVNAPPTYGQVRVDYVWVDTDGVPHGVADEIVNVGGQVAAAAVTAPAFSNVLSQQASAEGIIPYTVVLGDATNVDPLTGTTVLTADYGATLLLPSDLAGETMEISYTLKTEPYQFVNEVGDTVVWERRAPVMMEETFPPTESPYTIDLAFRGINDEVPLFETDLAGNLLDPAVFVLVLDLTTGQTWTDAEAWVDLDFIESRVTFAWDPDTGDADGIPSLAEIRGHDLRLYYRTIAGHTITVQKAPASYVERAVADVYVNPDAELYRTYDVAVDADPLYRQLVFPSSAAGQMVVVDYVVVDDTGAVTDRVSGELHAINGATLAITLNQPLPTVDGVIGILGVRGVSTTVRGWWHDTGGRVQMMGIDTFLAPEPLS